MKIMCIGCSYTKRIFKAAILLFQIIRFMSVLPVTTTTKERSFSFLRIVFRSTIKEVHLNGLDSLGIHRLMNADINLAFSEVFSSPQRV